MSCFRCPEPQRIKTHPKCHGLLVARLRSDRKLGNYPVSSSHPLQYGVAREQSHLGGSACVYKIFHSILED